MKKSFSIVFVMQRTTVSERQIQFAIKVVF